MNGVVSRCRILSWYFSLFLLLSCQGSHKPVANDAYRYISHKNVQYANGAVVCAHALAGEAGVDIMKSGGNAFDASIATQLALAVVYPGAGNIGGGGFMVARLANGNTVSLDFRESAPSAAHKDIYLDEQGNIVQDKSVRGPASSGVPGTIAGIFATLKYAKLPLSKLIEPAILLATNGFVITAAEAASLNSIQPDLNKYNDHVTAFHRNVWKEGDTLIQRDLAVTLKRIRDHGMKDFYEGETATLITAQMQRHGGLITGQDLKNYKAVWRTPHSFSYKGHTIISMGLPSSGGILLHQMMKMLENEPVKEYGHLSPSSVQLFTEVERRAYADRGEYLGDPDFVNVPVDVLTSDIYLKNRMKNYEPRKAGKSSDIRPGITSKESEETTHLSIIDNEGNAVSITTTLNDSYGSRTVVKGAGFFMNDEMDDFSIKAGAPNMYGAVGGQANAIAPKKRMLSSMCPVVVLKNNKPYIVAGTPGGTTIPTSVLQTLVNIIDYQLTTAEAVNSPKFHHQWLPDVIDVESDFPDSTMLPLKKMGYTFSKRDAIGRVEVIKVLRDSIFECVADKRGDDSAEGF